MAPRHHYRVVVGEVVRDFGPDLPAARAHAQAEYRRLQADPAGDPRSVFLLSTVAAGVHKGEAVGEVDIWGRP